MTIECKVDIRDAPAWARLDKALDRIEGRSKGPQPRATASLSNSPAGSSPRSSSSRDGLEGWDDSDLPNEGDLLHGGVDPVEGGVSDSDAPSGTEGEEEGKRPKRVLFKNLRHNTVKQLRKLAETTASHIAK